VPGGSNFVVAQVLLEIAEVGVRVDDGGFQADDLGEIFHVLRRDALAEAGVVGSAGVDPGGATGLEVGLVLPHGAGDGELGQRLGRGDDIGFVTMRRKRLPRSIRETLMAGRRGRRKTRRTGSSLPPMPRR